MKLLASGIFNKVFENRSHTLVYKLPGRTTLLTGETKKNLVYALEAHQAYLQDAVAKTEIKTGTISPRGYFMVQEFITGRNLYSEDLLDHTDLQAQFNHLVAQGIAMEKEKRLFFDTFGRNGLIHNFRQFFKKNPNFLYSNCLLTPEGIIKFIDIGYQPMSNPLAQISKGIRDYTSYLQKKRHKML